METVFGVHANGNGVSCVPPQRALAAEASSPINLHETDQVEASLLKGMAEAVQPALQLLPPCAAQHIYAGIAVVHRRSIDCLLP
jgi:hypothetical protein